MLLETGLGLGRFWGDFGVFGAVLGRFGVTRPPREVTQRGENWGEKGEKREKGKERKGEKRKEKSLGFLGWG